MGRGPARSVAAVLGVLTVLLAVACGSGGTDDADGTDFSPSATSTASVAPAVPRVIRTTTPAARTRDLTIASAALGRTAMVRLLLPARYEAEPRRRWPVLYLLHGCCDTYEGWTRSTDVEQLTADSDVLVVMPEGGAAGFYSDWRSGPRWETFHLDELRQILERDYRASDRRAVGGLSMGGFGALSYAGRRPGFFRAAASFSGIVHTRLTPERLTAYAALVRSQGEDPSALWGDPTADAETWASHNPYDLAPKLRGTPLLLSVGDGQPGPLDRAGASFDDLEAALAAENAALAARLRALGIPVRVDFYGPGQHIWPYWERELHRAWPMFRRALGVS